MKRTMTVCLFFITMGISHAQIFVNLNATGTNDGTSWANAFIDIQDALDASYLGDQLWIAAGTYVPQGATPDSSHFRMIRSVDLFGGFDGTESQLSERNWEINQTIISGDINGDDRPGDFFTKRTDNAHHILIVDSGIGEPVIDGFLFRGGATRLDNYAPIATDFIGYDRWRGGAIYIRNTTARISNCIFIENVGYQGSALFARDTSFITHNLTIENVRFENNYALNSAACLMWPVESCFIQQCTFKNNEAGNFGAGLVIVNANAIIEDCVFDNNLAGSQGGACFIAHNTSSVDVHPLYHFNRCHFIGNSAAASGGALQLDNYSKGFDLLFDSCSFIRNTTTNTYASGGAIAVIDYADIVSNESPNFIEITNSEFRDNQAAFGAGIFIEGNDDSLYVKILNTLVTNHSGISGAGLYLANYGESTILKSYISNSNFLKNSITGLGGGIYFDGYANGYSQFYEIDSCTFSHNSATAAGGAIYSRAIGSMEGAIGKLRNSHFTYNQAIGYGGAIASYEEHLTIENCTFSDNSTEGIASADFNGGGALIITLPKASSVQNTFFRNNNSDNGGSAVLLIGGGETRFENVVFQDNVGQNTIENRGNLHLVNTSMIDNIYGLYVVDQSMTTIQNTIFSNTFSNFISSGNVSLVSRGSNISSDITLKDYLNGFEMFEDLHSTDPAIGSDLIPLSGSPCVDAGNPDGVKLGYDIGGNPRIHGGGIDIGAYEKVSVSVKEVVLDKFGFTTYPNPSAEVVNLVFESDWIGDIPLRIFNTLGQQVYQSTLHKSLAIQTCQLNLKNLLPGDYIILANARQATHVANIIIQK